MIGVSAGTASLLGLHGWRSLCPPTTAYFMLGDSCQRNCLFCAGARESDKGSRARLARVSWPLFNQQQVLAALADRQNKLQRICLQTVCTSAARQQARRLLPLLQRYSLPVSISINVETPRTELTGLLADGADRLALPLDAATPVIYGRMKEGNWQIALQNLFTLQDAFPGRVTTHLIAGLGESEQEMLELICQLVERGITVGLFAFTPVPGSKLAHQKQPEPDSYRRLQTAFYLLRRRLIVPEDLIFAGGRLRGINITRERLKQYLAGGDAFRTTGCPGCNRPFYNESPRGFMYNYPRPLTPQEAEREISLVAECLS